MTSNQFAYGMAMRQLNGQRMGQAAWNTLASYYPAACEAITGDQTLDCFYKDERIDAFLTWASVLMLDDTKETNA